MAAKNRKISELSFRQLREANVKRCEESFHPLTSWSPSDWATAMAGECGEACNVIKKLRRMAPTPEEAGEVALSYGVWVSQLEDELADLVTYADLLAARFNIDLGQAVTRKFAEVSDRVGSPITLDEPRV